MAEFCECGSLVIDSRCTNKSCSLRAATKPASVKKTTSKVKTSGKTQDAAKSSLKSQNLRRASKCITYNLYDIKEKESES